MTSAQRILKRSIIISVYLLIGALFVVSSYYFFRTKPTCADRIQNQGETGIDCGGPCQKCEEIPKAENLKVIEKAIIVEETGKYDALAMITNPNPQFGAERFDYSFNLLDEAGKIITKSSGTSFILPGQTKYILAFNMIPVDAKPEKLDFQINSFEWSRFSEFEEPDIAVYAKEFNLASGGEPGFAKLKAKMRNQSGFDFRKISAAAVIRNENGSPIAINETNFNDVRANEEREMNFNWNSPFPIDPMSARIEIVPEANVFENSNFMKKHGVVGQYRSYETGE